MSALRGLFEQWKRTRQNDDIDRLLDGIVTALEYRETSVQEVCNAKIKRFLSSSKAGSDTREHLNGPRSTHITCSPEPEDP